MRGFSQAQIGQRLNVSARRIGKALDRALDGYEAESRKQVARLRKVEAKRLDDLTMAVWDDAIAGNLPAIDRVLKIRERYARLLGLDAQPGLSLADVPLGPQVVVNIPIFTSPVNDTVDGEVIDAQIEAGPDLSGPHSGPAPDATAS